MTSRTDSRAVGESELDLRELAGIMVDRKWWLLGTTMLFMLGGLAYALLAPRVYLAQAMVQVESKVPSIPGLADLASLGGSGSTASTTEVALLTSRTSIGEAVDALHWDVSITPYRLPVIGDFYARNFKPQSDDRLAPSRFGLSSYGWGGEDIVVSELEVVPSMVDATMMLQVGAGGKDYVLYDEDGNVILKGAAGAVAQGKGVKIFVESLDARPGMRFEVVKRRRLDVLSELQRDINVVEDGKDSGILQVTYESTDPLRAEALVQRLVEAYVRQNVERSSAEAASQLKFVKDQLPTIRLQVERAQLAMSAYQSRANSVDITMQTKGLLEQEVAVEASIQQLRLKQAEMDRSFTREHPAYRALLTQLAGLESRKGGFQREVGRLPETQQELLRLTRDLQVSNELYTALLNQAQQLDVARAGAVGNVRIVDAAVSDVANPIKPRRGLVVLIATVLGACLALGVVLVQRLLNPGIEDPADIEALGLPVYAAIPLSVSNALPKLRKGKHGTRVIADGRQHLLAVNSPADPTVEALRSLRTSLHFAMLEAKNNILTISGPRPGVGKTFVSTNLAAVIALAGQRVLVIDADMRKGTLHKILGVSHQKGLSDLLAGKLTAEEAIRPVSGLDNMHYMVRGEIPPNPAELLMHPRFVELLDSVATQYDLVIVDTPPILAVTDAALVAAHAGSSLLVTRFGVNQPKEIELTMQRFEQNGVQVKGAIFNAVEKRATGYYSYGYYEYKSDDKG
ncbi:polysaccharide biosynthesis tyrosine autokinase [Stenotrophomonas sp. SORGH_AS_0321]|uniref:polysaccharide biosynthesis tyrosine autokinase n=1 Tax=Stenotrophomonas sp. SORGH_AS_0321 TaxID=3041787 RepID=UPI00286CB495|nr:polysaccharide biosynthesis tyrosine autokinase [Stenotrophomonas sp. SORGH_AS_0321]